MSSKKNIEKTKNEKEQRKKKEFPLPPQQKILSK